MLDMLRYILPKKISDGYYVRKFLTTKGYELLGVPTRHMKDTGYYRIAMFGTLSNIEAFMSREYGLKVKL